MEVFNFDPISNTFGQTQNLWFLGISKLFRFFKRIFNSTLWKKHLENGLFSQKTSQRNAHKGNEVKRDFCQFSILRDIELATSLL